MNERENLVAAIGELSVRGADAAGRVEALLGPEIETYRAEVTAAVHNGIEQLKEVVSQASGGNPFCTELMNRTGEYLDWLQWTLWDLPGFAAIIRPKPAVFRAALAGCSLIYFAGRILDDFLDRHYLYRGRRQTLLANLHAPGGPHADGMLVMVALLVFTEGVTQLCGIAGADLAVRSVLDSAKRVYTGVLMEYSNPQAWDESFYERLIGLKNVDYWRILYVALDPERVSPLYPFLGDYYALAQKLNDVQDFARDAGQGRPNLISIAQGFDGAENRVGRDLLELARQAEGLPGTARLLALAKLAETCEEARRAGLFAAASHAAGAGEANWSGISWQSEIQEFIDLAGPGVVQATACPVCGSGDAAALFRKQGFAYSRCGECGHVYVSPRLRGEIGKAVRKELVEIPISFWPGEKLFAADWVRVLRSHTEGKRWLDVRFEEGIFPRVARAAGVQVYGAGPAAHLRTLFGERVAETDLEAGAAPWGSFDAVTMLHSMDRFSEPRVVLQTLRAGLNPGGVILIVAPDGESLQFRIFGKRWDAVNPVARDHLFCERSLFRLLRECGFEIVERLATPVTPYESRTRWMRLFRGMEGDETGDLMVLARVAPGL